MSRADRVRLCAGLLLALVGGAADAQAWPSGPVHVIVPFDAGSTPDLVARIVSEGLATRLGQSFVVENRSGAAGNIGTNAVAKAAPDGQTIGVSIAGPLAVNPLLYKTMPYDAGRDLDPITVAVSQPSVLVFGPRGHGAGAKELVALLKSGHARLNFGSVGAGLISHLGMEALAARVGGEFTHIPYRGSAAAVTALLGGDIDLALLPAGAVVPFIRDGKLRALAVASAERSPSLPDLPTLAESGLADVHADAWVGFIAPAKTPAPIVARLHDQIVQVLADPAVAKRLRDRFMDPVGSTPAEFRSLLAADVARWKPVIEKNKIVLD